jgi:hypothetical protein
MTGEFGLHAQRLAGLGYEPIPISLPTDGGNSPGKRPAQPRGWQTGCPVEQWPAFARYGVGILTRTTPGVDIDVKDRPLAEKIQELADRALGEAPYRIGAAPKRLMPFRLAGDPFPKIKVTWRGLGDEHHEPTKPPAVEILSDGQQFVALGVHPGTGSPYQWRRDPDLSLPRDLLPALDRDRAERFIRALAGALERHGGDGHQAVGRRRPGRDRSHAPGASYRRREASRGGVPGEDRQPGRPADHRRAGRRGPGAHGQRRSALRRLDPNRSRHQGRARRGRPVRLALVVEPVQQEQRSALAPEVGDFQSTADHRGDHLLGGTPVSDSFSAAFGEEWQQTAFTPTHEWQDVPEGAILPQGLEYNIDMTTGRKQARIQAAPEPEQARPRPRPDSKGGAVIPGPGAKAPLKPYPGIRLCDMKPNLLANEIIQGLLSRSGFGEVHAAAGGGKTAIIVDMMLHVAAGIEYRGRRTEMQPVVYVALEGHAGIENRVVAAAAHLGIDDAAFELLKVSDSFRNPEAAARVARPQRS